MFFDRQRKGRRLAFRLRFDDARKYEALFGRVFGVHTWTELIERALADYWTAHGAPMPAGDYVPPRLLDDYPPAKCDRPVTLNFDADDQAGELAASRTSTSSAAGRSAPTRSRAQPSRKHAPSRSRSSTSSAAGRSAPAKKKRGKA